MNQRNVKLFIMLVIGVGAYLLIRARTEHHEVKQEYDRLVGKVGRFEITDPTKLHFAPIATDDPFDFAWRVYVPAGLSINRVAKGISGGSSSSYMSASAESVEAIWRTRLRFNRESIQIFAQGSSGSSLTGGGNKKLAEFLRDHRDELQIEALAEEGPTAYDTDQVLTLLKIEIPEHLHAEALRVLNRGTGGRSKLAAVILVQIGTAKAFAAAEKKR